MVTISAIQRKLDKLELDKSEILKQKLAIVRRVLLFCVKCNRKSRLGAWTFIQGRHYVRPFSCNGGDYWTYSKTETCDITCPKCGANNYIHIHPQRNKIVELITVNHFSLQEIFKNVTEKFHRE